MCKTKAMSCTPGFIWVQQVAEAYNRRAIVEGAAFWERNRIRVSYMECGGTMEESSLRHHMER